MVTDVKITPKNWRDFQHYKDRSPPWIRLHRALLDNKDFHRLPVASRALAPMLWLLASESVGGAINADCDDLAFRLRTTEKDIRQALQPLIDKGFFIVEQDASAVLAACGRVAVPEAEAETEALHLNPDAEAVSGSALLAAPPSPPAFDGNNAEALNGKAIVPIAAAWELPETWGVDAESLGWKPPDVIREAEKFRQYWTSGRGSGTTRSVKGWRQSWSNWLEKAARDKR